MRPGLVDRTTACPTDDILTTIGHTASQPRRCRRLGVGSPILRVCRLSGPDLLRAASTRDFGGILFGQRRFAWVRGQAPGSASRSLVSSDWCRTQG
jgi:hypothetical protein